MQFELMLHVGPDLLGDRQRVRDFGEVVLHEFFNDTSELDARWRREGDTDARISDYEEFSCGNLLISGEIWPHQMPESLPFLGGEFIEIDEGVGAMAMSPGMVRATSEYLNSLNIDDLLVRNARHFSDDPEMSAEDKMELGRQTILEVREFYERASRDGKAVVNVGSVI